MMEESNKNNKCPNQELQALSPIKRTIDHIASSPELICINVGGKKHYVMVRNFAKLPHSRLSELVRANTSQEILSLCDKHTPGDIPEYFFDRSWKGFNDVLDCYRMGRLHLNDGGKCAMRSMVDIKFWKINELMLDPCCARKYYPEIETCTKEIEDQADNQKKFLQRMKEEDFGDSKIAKIRKYLWNLTEYPETSLAARITAFTSLSVVIISTVTFILSTIPELTDDIDIQLFDNVTDIEASENGQVDERTSLIGPVEPPVERWEEGILALKIVDWVTMWFFTIEYGVRFACSPKKWRFFTNAMNMVDLLAILPYLISIVVDSIRDAIVIGKAGKVLRLVRVMRILRVLKLVRHFAGLQSLLSTLKQAYKELGLLMILVSVSVLTFSSLVYFAEKDGLQKWSFLDSFWWGLMVLTTVGYGAKAPETYIGQAIGGFMALVGVFVLALPVPIVVNSFSSNYKNRLWRNEVLMRKQEQEETDTFNARNTTDNKPNGTLEMDISKVTTNQLKV